MATDFFTEFYRSIGTFFKTFKKSINDINDIESSKSHKVDTRCANSLLDLMERLIISNNELTKILDRKIINITSEEFIRKFELEMGVSFLDLTTDAINYCVYCDEDRKMYSSKFILKLLDMMKIIANNNIKLEKNLQDSKRTKYNKYLDSLCKGNTPVKISSGEPDAIEALEIIEGDCRYMDYDFGESIYSDGRNSYVIIWK